MMPALVLSIVAVALIGRFWYRNIAAHRIANCDWNELFGKLETLPRLALAEVGEDYLNPKPNQLFHEPGDIWLRVGGIKGLRTMRRNARILIALAAYAERWNFTESVIVRERMRRDALHLQMATSQIMLRRLTHVGQVRLVFHLHESVASYHLMTRRLLALYQTSHAGLYPRLEQMLGTDYPQRISARTV